MLVDFYTVEAAKLLPDIRRESKNKNNKDAMNYQKVLEGFDRTIDRLFNAIKNDNLLLILCDLISKKEPSL
ncbi:hypothetical protein [Vibrio sp. 10N.286.49.B3]|uniref:hypothetical protein n=1 Tax=Vibrio sp. 10N.286.49.B3 TaxID=1880855 RepID=UPI001055F1E3|nr:hypothetical protein [Vibrio sp. 10N.286.49.B3]